MIKIENTVLPSVEQIEFIIEGMRNPMNSWEKSDSKNDVNNKFILGENDYDLMQRLAKAGTEHRKYMRMMPVYVRITAPLYWWKEFDTYQVGVCPNPTDIIKNSCSTMHKIAEKEFTLEDFSCEHLYFDDNHPLHAIDCNDYRIDGNGYICLLINILNYWRKKYLETKSKDMWWQMIQLLPSSYNQTRNVMLNYEVLANIYRQRKNHKLDEWREVCKWIETLPYKELITGEYEGKKA